MDIKKIKTTSPHKWAERSRKELRNLDYVTLIPEQQNLVNNIRTLLVRLEVMLEITHGKE